MAVSRGLMLALLPPLASAAGVSAYLPADLPPREARQLQLLFLLADSPVMRRPIAIARVQDAMTRACPRDRSLCDSIERWLQPYLATAAVTSLAGEAALTDGSSTPLPNAHGLRSDDAWQLSAEGHWRPGAHVLLGVGAIARDGRVVPTGTALSVGNEYAQLDAGFLDRWSSPLQDSAFLMSTQAPAMPSVTLSNTRPITRLGLSYEAFLSRMSRSERIFDDTGLTRGHPWLAGLEARMEPARGWSLGITRQLQYGGGARDSSPGSLLKAFFNPSHYDNFRPGRPAEFGNQQAAWSSSFVYPGRVPFIVSMEFAGEDTSHSTPGRLGNAGVSLELNVPRVWHDFGLRYAISEWQDGWYTHHIYQDGLTNHGDVVGLWGADWRVPQDFVGARSQSLALQWDPPGDRSLVLELRTLQNGRYTGIAYRRAVEFGAEYSMAATDTVRAGAELVLGRDVFGSHFARLAAFARLQQAGSRLGTGTDDAADTSDTGASVFVDAGISLGRIQDASSIRSVPKSTSGTSAAPHLGLGARRTAGVDSDLGARIEVDRVNGHMLVAVRALDYRYRLNGALAVTAFLGAARYALAPPAYGYYVGGGLQWRDVRPRWDLNLDLRYGDELAHDDLGPDGTLAGNDSFHSLFGLTLYLSRRF